MSQAIVIIGGGVAGLMNAYQLNRAGHRVTVIDRGTIEDNTSFGNAGLLSAFEKAPLSNPGVISRTLKLMLQGKSPLLLNPTLDPKIYAWLLRFMASSTHSRLKKTLILFERYGHMALEEYKRIIDEEHLDFDFHHDGVYLVFTEQKSYQEKLAHAKDTHKYEVLSYDEAKTNLGFVKENIEGVINLKRNARMNPAKMMLAMKETLINKGVTFILEEEILDFEFHQGKLTKAIGRKDSYTADTFVLCSGADIALAKKAGQDLMLTPAKGYSLTFEMDEAIKPKQCVMFNDLFIIATPRKDDMRLTSKLELGSKDPKVVQRRIDSIVTNLKAHTIDFELKNLRTWTGFRPLTPNDMPLIGRDPTYRNLVYGMGYGWLGITFGPALAMILENLITEDLENHQNDDILLFSGFYQGCL